MGQTLVFFSRMPLMLLATICTLALPLGATAGCKLRVGWDDWPPYITYANGRFQGLEYKLLKATADAAGCTLEMIHVPWIRALSMLGENALDLLYGADYSEERARFARFSIPYRNQAFVLVTRGKPSHEKHSISLSAWLHSPKAGQSPLNLGLFQGDFYGQKIERVLKESSKEVILIRLNTTRQMVGMLALGRLDGFIVEDGVARMELASARFPMRSFIIREEVTDPLYYMFSVKVSDDVIKRFDAAIRERQSQTKDGW